MARVAVLPASESLGVVDARKLLGERPPPDVHPETGVPLELRPFVVSQEPRVVVVPQFLSPAECKHLLELAGGQWTRSLVGQLPSRKHGDRLLEGEDTVGDAGSGGLGMQTKQAATRTSTSCMLRSGQTVVLERIEHRLASLAKQPLENLERLVVVRYSPGEQFSEHHDGKFRPVTVFIYLNELPEEDDGHTYFPHLGLSFVPRTGCAVMWPNATPEGTEDSRMVHAGLPPRSAVKFGVNCFFNEEKMRLVDYPEAQAEAHEAFVVDLAARRKEEPEQSEPGKQVLRTMTLQTTPELKASPGFASEEEVSHLLALADGKSEGGGEPVFADGTSLVRTIAPRETEIVSQLEQRLAAVARFPPEHLGWMRVVRCGSAYGLCNRGCGQRAAIVCLAEKDEVFFPHLSLRLLLRKGDLVSWPNAWRTESIGTSRVRVVEDMRSTRVHLRASGEAPPLALEACFHDSPVTQRLPAAG